MRHPRFLFSSVIRNEFGGVVVDVRLRETGINLYEEDDWSHGVVQGMQNRLHSPARISSESCQCHVRLGSLSQPNCR